jgi:hypothetical protein
VHRLPRTSCAAEAFHSGFNHRIEQNPFFSRYVRFVQKQLMSSQQRIVEVITGGSRKRVQANVIRDEMIEEAVSKFGTLDLPDYLKRCGVALHSVHMN